MNATCECDLRTQAETDLHGVLAAVAERPVHAAHTEAVDEVTSQPEWDGFWGGSVEVGRWGNVGW